MLGPSGVELEKEFFWIWFICTLEGCILLWLYFFSTKCLLRNTLLLTHSTCIPPEFIFPKSIFLKSIYPKCILAKCTRLACLLCFARLFFGGLKALFVFANSVLSGDLEVIFCVFTWFYLYSFCANFFFVWFESYLFVC